MAKWFKMRATDPDAVSLTYRYWTVQGIPDMDGRCYRGPRSGSTALANVNVLSEYNDGLPSWKKTYEINFQRQTSATYAASGVVTVDSIPTWNAFNATNASPSMDISASGLTITPIASTVYVTTRTLPGLQVPCWRLNGDYSMPKGVRMWVYVSASNHAANNDSVVAGFDLNGTGFAHTLARGFNAAGNQGFTTNMLVAGASQSTALSDTVTVSNTVNNVMVIEATISSGFLFRTYYGTYGIDWPGEQELTLLRSYLNGSLAINANFVRTTWGPFVGAQRNGSGTAYVATLGAMKMEYMF